MVVYCRRKRQPKVTADQNAETQRIAGEQQQPQNEQQAYASSSFSTSSSPIDTDIPPPSPPCFILDPLSLAATTTDNANTSRALSSALSVSSLSPHSRNDEGVDDIYGESTAQNNTEKEKKKSSNSSSRGRKRKLSEEEEHEDEYTERGDKNKGKKIDKKNQKEKQEKKEKEKQKPNSSSSSISSSHSHAKENSDSVDGFKRTSHWESDFVLPATQTSPESRLSRSKSHNTWILDNLDEQPISDKQDMVRVRDLVE